MAKVSDSDGPRPGLLLRAAFGLMLLLIVSLAFMQPAVRLLGFAAVPTDLIFLLTALAFVGAVLTRQIKLRWNNAYWLLLAYFGAMALSGLQDLRVAVPKLASQVYLLSLPVLADQLLSQPRRLRNAVCAWLAGTILACAAGLLALGLFAWNPEHPWLDHLLFHFGTLPPGSYPRLRLTFLNANMACNYLSVSLLLLLGARHSGWLSKSAFVPLLAAILVVSVFTISPGLAGVVAGLAIWGWLLWREERPGAARVSLLAAVGVAVASIPVMALTPVLHSTAPFLIDLPGITLAPAGRLMIWMDAARNFLADPLLGRGIGQEAVLVRYSDPSGNLQRLTDAHNSFLHIAVQCGVVGLLALLLIVAHAVRLTGPFRLLQDRSNTLRLAIGIAFLNGFVLQGLGGSFEDARHLWVLFGLLLAADRIARAGATEQLRPA